ncbi:DUF974-domain-containing protein [Phanerochaete sordida]|uniref:DUF974-domain-containing protein n=1 Tax=Phanerochaete sordida TaxID=48140 RepID=A0A9P3G0M4_9APHY|nr:DUF974-domain-containing protein [Phanerochaete sordida]
MEGGSQLLSLKVMRVSRPALATAWEPFYSSSPSFSAHSTASVMSLQGKAPLPGHPKTLRDLTHISEMLTLPSAFGSIQLGETFSSCLAVNNEASVDIEGVILRVEMQTATTKQVLVEYGGPDYRLAPGDAMENVVHHEIKELGQHVLACTVSYHLPPGHRPVHPAGEGHDPSVQSFRKFYKFAVTNPLSVKTKVHVPRAPSALLSTSEREKVFLEVHIQNLTPDAMWLQRLRFEPVEGWNVQDVNKSLSSETKGDETIFQDSTAMMQPQDTRQYVYILSPKELSPFPVNHAPGSIIPLGRLDISWRSAFGEPGRLLTSMLSRRIPLIQGAGSSQPPVPPPKQPPSALPLHLQRSNTTATGAGTPPRVGSPQLSQRPMSPPVSGGAPAPYRPGSPFRRGTATGSLSTLPQSPTVAAPPTPNPALRRPDENVDVHLVVTSIQRDSIYLGKPFTIAFTATVSAPVALSTVGQPRKQRVLSLVVQHVEPPRPASASLLPSAPAPSTIDTWSPRLPSSGFSTPSPYGTPHRGDFPDNLAQRLLVASPRQATFSASDADDEDDGGELTPAPPTREDRITVVLPPPFSAGDSADAPRTQAAKFLGPSALFLPRVHLLGPQLGAGDDAAARGHGHSASESSVESDADSDLHATLVPRAPRVLASADFELTFVPVKAGFAAVGGLRVLLAEDRVVEGEDAQERPLWLAEARTLREWDVVAEVWVKSSEE